MISLWFFNKAKKRWVVSSRGSAGNYKLPTTWSSYMRLWDPNKVILLQMFREGPCSWGFWESLLKNACPPQHTHTHSLYICKSHGGKCVSWGEDGTILNLHTLSRALSGEVQQKNTNNDSVLINLPSCIMQIYSTCIFNGTTTAYTHAGILIYVLTGRRSKYGEFLTNGSHRETPQVEFSH